MRTLVSFLKATLRGGGGGSVCWRWCWDEEDRADAPEDDRRGGKGACGAGTGDGRSTLASPPPPMGRLSLLFHLIMAGCLAGGILLERVV